MKVSRKSWHFKAIKLWNRDYSPADNLCQYFWLLVGCLVLSLIVGVFVVGLAPLWAPLFGFTAALEWLDGLDLKHETKAKWWHGIAITGIALGFLVLIGGFSFFLSLPHDGSLSTGIVMSLVVAMIFTCGYVFGLFELLYEGLGQWFNSYEYVTREHRRSQPPPQPKEPGILISWLKAKKQKVCPLIDYVD